MLGSPQLEPGNATTVYQSHENPGDAVIFVVETSTKRMAPVRRNSYTHKFKLMVIASAERVGNREAARQHGCSEKGVRDWRRMEVSIRAAPRQHRAVSNMGGAGASHR